MRWRVEFEVTLPDDVTRPQVEEWIGYELCGGSMDGALHDRLGGVMDATSARPRVTAGSLGRALNREPEAKGCA